MLTPQAVERELQKLFQGEQLAVLSTVQNDQPYASLVAVSATDDLAAIVFCTPVTTRKFENLSANPRVALLINNSRNQASDIYQAVAVTAIGTAATIADGERSALAARYLQKHPYLKDFLRATSTALVKVAVERYIMVHNFQNVYDYKVTA